MHIIYTSLHYWKHIQRQTNLSCTETLQLQVLTSTIVTFCLVVTASPRTGVGLGSPLQSQPLPSKLLLGEISMYMREPLASFPMR